MAAGTFSEAKGRSNTMENIIEEAKEILAMVVLSYVIVSILTMLL